MGMPGAVSSKRDKLNVVMVRPLGKGGKGGIDRIVQNQIDSFVASDFNIFEIVTRGQLGIVASPFYLLSALVKLITLYLFKGVDLVHVNLSSDGSVTRKKIVIRLCRNLKIPYVIHLHGSRFKAYWDCLPDNKSDQLKRCFEKAAVVFALGEVWRDYILSKAPSARVELLLNATAPAQTQAASTPRKDGVTRILFLGLIGERKGTFDLINALAMLDSRDLGSWQVTLAGNGDLAKARGLIDAKNLTHKIGLPGWVDPAKAEALLLDADILVLPSYDENLPMSVIEGMAHGLAIVTTPVGATASIIQDNVTGLLVRPGDIAALAGALGSLISDVQLAEGLGAQAREFHTQNLTIDVHVERLANLWRLAAIK